MRMVLLCGLLFLSPFLRALPMESLDKVVAVINDNVITQHELDTQTELLRQQLLAKRMSMPSDTVLRKQVLQHLIDVDLQLQIAKNNDITIDATELDATIAKIAQDNKLSLTQLREALAHEGLTWEMYRDNLRKEMLIARLQQRSVGRDIDVTTQEVEDYIQTEKTNDSAKRVFHVQNILIPLPEEPTPGQITKAQQKAKDLLAKLQQGEDFSLLAVAQSSDEYALEGGDLGERHLAELPEIFAQAIVKMKVGEVSEPLRTGNGFQLIKLVATVDSEAHHQVTKTHVRHILLKQDVNMTDEEALKQINNLYEQLKSGKDFGLMAKLYSLDASSAAKGGDLGWVVSDELVKPFAEAMAALPLHTISKPVKSQFGWHLIEVLARQEVDDSKAYQRQKVRMLLQQRKFNEAVQNWKRHMRAEAYVTVVDKTLA